VDRGGRNCDMGRESPPQHAIGIGLDFGLFDFRIEVFCGCQFREMEGAFDLVSIIPIELFDCAGSRRTTLRGQSDTDIDHH